MNLKLHLIWIPVDVKNLAGRYQTMDFPLSSKLFNQLAIEAAAMVR